MDLFMSITRGLGLAIAAGLLLPALLRLLGAQRAGGVADVLAGGAGGALFAISLSEANHRSWPGIAAGAVIAIAVAELTRAVIAGAEARQGSGSRSVALYVGLAALVLAGASLLLPPVSIPAALALVWLAVTRRRRAARKHEGLRVLR
jgi:hypothetical protein